MFRQHHISNACAVLLLSAALILQPAMAQADNGRNAGIVTLGVLAAGAIAAAIAGGDDSSSSSDSGQKRPRKAVAKISPKAKAQKAWAKLDPAVRTCLDGQLSPPPEKLIEAGITPQDTRLAQAVAGCKTAPTGMLATPIANPADAPSPVSAAIAKAAPVQPAPVQVVQLTPQETQALQPAAAAPAGTTVASPTTPSAPVPPSSPTAPVAPAPAAVTSTSCMSAEAGSKLFVAACLLGGLKAHGDAAEVPAAQQELDRQMAALSTCPQGRDMASKGEKQGSRAQAQVSKLVVFRQGLNKECETLSRALPQPKAENAPTPSQAAAVIAGGASPSAIADKWKGKYPSVNIEGSGRFPPGQRFYDEAAIASGLARMPKDISAKLSQYDVETPIELKNGLLVASACKPHDCGDNNVLLLFDVASGKLEACAREAGHEYWVSDGKTPVADGTCRKAAEQPHLGSGRV